MRRPGRMRETRAKAVCRRLPVRVRNLGRRRATRRQSTFPTLAGSHTCHGPSEGFGVIRIGECRLRHFPGRGKAGTEVPGFYETDPDTETPHFHCKGLAVPLDCELRGGIEPLVGNCNHPGYGTDVDNAPAALPSHVRENGRADTGHTHEIGFHLPAPLLFGSQFERAPDSGTGIVHQHVDASLGSYDFSYRLLNGRRDSDIEAQHPHPVVTCPFLYRAAGTIDDMTGGREHSGRGPAESGSGSRYQYYLCGPHLRNRGRTLPRTAAQAPPTSGWRLRQSLRYTL